MGFDCKLYRNTAVTGSAINFASPTWDLIPNVRDASVQMEMDEADTTIRGSVGGAKLTNPATLSLTIEFSMVWDTADADMLALRTAMFARTAVDLLAIDQTTTGGVSPYGQGPRAVCALFAGNRPEPVNGLVTYDVVAKPCYDTATLANNGVVWFTGA
jgi:hypothetical protein